MVSATTPSTRESGSKGSTSSTPATGSGTKTVKVAAPPKEKKQVYSDLADSNLDPDVVAFLNEIDDNESLDGDAYFSDEDSNVSNLALFGAFTA